MSRRLCARLDNPWPPLHHAVHRPGRRQRDVSRDGVTYRSRVRKRGPQESHPHVVNAAGAFERLMANDRDAVCEFLASPADAQQADGTDRHSPRALNQAP